MVLDFKVNGQTITQIKDCTIPRTNSRKYLKLRFQFDEAWQQYSKKIFFSTDQYSKAVNFDSNDLVEVPEYFTQFNKFNIVLVGAKGDTFVPTNELRIVLDNSGATDEILPPDEEIPMAEQLLIAALKAEESAKKAAKSAEEATSSVSTAVNQATEAAKSAEEAAKNAQEQVDKILNSEQIDSILNSVKQATLAASDALAAAELAQEAATEAEQSISGLYDGAAQLYVKSILVSEDEQEPSPVATKNYVDDNSPFVVEDGVVKSKIQKIQVGGINKDGYAWRQLELAQPLDEPYLNEWGYKCCLEQGQWAVDMYKWLYRCAYEKYDIPQRTICVIGRDGVERQFVCQTDSYAGTNYTSMVIELILESNGFPVPIREEGETDEAFAERLEAYDKKREVGKQKFAPDEPDNFRVLNIPLLQFSEINQFDNEDRLKIITAIIYRVKEDNPELFYTNYPTMENVNNKQILTPCFYENDKFNLGIGRGILYNRVIMPTRKKAMEMVSYCRDFRENVKDKVYNFYNIKPGDVLNLEQKKRVIKVAHDYLDVNAELNNEIPEGYENRVYLLPTMASAMSKNFVSLCAGYTQALNYLIREYNIHALYMSGLGEYVRVVKREDTGIYEAYIINGGHAWNMVQMTNFQLNEGTGELEDKNYIYGNYSNNPQDWTCIDVYWDEPSHAQALSQKTTITLNDQVLGEDGKTIVPGEKIGEEFIPEYVVPAGALVCWKYFMNKDAIFAHGEKYPKHIIDSSGGYGFNMLPTGLEEPAASYPYEGNTLYKWEES